MKKLFKKLALMVVALLTFSVGSNYTVKEVKAAGTTATLSFANKAQRTAFSTTKQVWEQNGITLTNDKSGSTSNVGDYAAPARFYKSSKLTIEYSENITQIVFDCNSSSYATALKNSIPTSTKDTVTVSSDKVTVILNDPATSFVISSLTGGQVRMDSLTLTYTTGESGEQEKTPAQLVESGVNYVKSLLNTFYGESVDIVLPATNEDGINFTYELNETNSYFAIDEDGVFTINPTNSLKSTTLMITAELEGESKTENYDIYSLLKNSTLTIAEAIIAAEYFSEGGTAYSSDKYYVVGNIVDVYDTTYGNMYINDGTSEDNFTIYGTYSADGKTRYDALDVKPIAGDTVKLYGQIGAYKGKVQMQYANIVEHIQNSTNEELIKMVETTASLGFDYTYDEVETTKLVPATEATLTFDDKAKRTEYSTSKQVWSENGVTFTNEKGSSTTNVGDYSNPVRAYKNSDITIEVDGPISKIIFDSATGEYLGYLKDSLTNFEVDSSKDNLIICNLDKTSNTYSLTATAGQVRFNSITVFYGDDKEITTTTKDFTNSKFDDISILFGAEVDASLFKDFTKVTAGVMFSAGNELKADTAKKCPVETLVETNGVYSVGAVLEVFTEGDIVNNDTKVKLSQNITAAVYFVVDGETLVLASKTVSVASMVETYLGMCETNNDIKNHEEALKALKAYIES